MITLQGYQVEPSDIRLDISVEWNCLVQLEVFDIHFPRMMQAQGWDSEPYRPGWIGTPCRTVPRPSRKRRVWFGECGPSGVLDRTSGLHRLKTK